jgi:hypothetical protein
MIKAGHSRPFEIEEIVICSYQFARNKADDVANTPWDLVVIDEAHRRDLKPAIGPAIRPATIRLRGLGAKDSNLEPQRLRHEVPAAFVAFFSKD